MDAYKAHKIMDELYAKFIELLEESDLDCLDRANLIASLYIYTHTELAEGQEYVQAKKFMEIGIDKMRERLFEELKEVCCE